MFKKSPGFTLYELLTVVAIIGILASSSIIYLGRAKERSRYARAKSELEAIATAVQHYLNDYGQYPADVNRSLPSGLEDYLPQGNWPGGPWTDSVYDWDNWTIDGAKVYQTSLRFCTDQSNCNMPAIFPQFDYYSAMYYCLEGSCRAHVSQPADHPGLCVNCNDDEGAILWNGG